MLRSAMSGSLRLGPRPPWLRGDEAQAKCEYAESVETPAGGQRACVGEWRATHRGRRC